MRYCIAKNREMQEEKAYRIYMSDTLNIIAKNTGRYAGGEFMTVRYADLINPKPRDERSCEEITADVIKRCGLVVKE